MPRAFRLCLAPIATTLSRSITLLFLSSAMGSGELGCLLSMELASCWPNLALIRYSAWWEGYDDLDLPVRPDPAWARAFAPHSELMQNPQAGKRPLSGIRA